MPLELMRLENTQGVIEFIAPRLAILWKDWPSPMEATLLNARVEKAEEVQFSLGGKCPHCTREVAFMMVTSAHIEDETDRLGRATRSKAWAVMTCVSCKEYILGAVHFAPHHARECHYFRHYPLGTPDQSVEEQVPALIAGDFREALRCRWVNAFNATAEMCRRAVESSCIDLKVPNTKQYRALEDKIDWLAKQGIITAFLQEVAHKIRLGGNRGAHPDAEDEPEPLVITDEHADAIIKFTREFFHHVYVVRNELDKYDFRRGTGILGCNGDEAIL